MKTEDVRVPEWPGGRDNGKVFRITEMRAAQAEKWGWRMLLALNRAGGEIPQNVQNLGMVGVAILGINTFLRGNIKFEELEPLFDEMMECVQAVLDPKKHSEVAMKIPLDHVQDARTIAWLRSEVLRVHTGFSPAAALSALISAVMVRPPVDSGST